MTMHVSASSGNNNVNHALAMAATVVATVAAGTYYASYCEPTITMEELIGDMPDVTCTSGTVTVKGLKVRWWKYGPLGRTRKESIERHTTPHHTTPHHTT